MTGRTVNVEWVVSEVLRRLERLAHAPAEPGAPPAGPPYATAESLDAQAPQPAPEAGLPPGDLIVPGRVVGLAAVEGRLAGIRRVLVPAGAVVTPAVKDLLRKRHVPLEVLPADDPRSTAARHLLVARCTNSRDASRAAADLAPPGDARALDFENLTTAVQAVARTVGDPHRLTVVVTDQPLLAVCLANRSAAVRAAWVRSGSELREAVAAISPNCLVIHPLLFPAAHWPELLATYQELAPRHRPPWALVGVASPEGSSRSCE